MLAPAHDGTGGRRGRFPTVEKRRWGCAGCRVQSASVSGERWRDGAGSFAYLGYPVTKMLARATPNAPQRLRVELEQRISTHEETLEKAVRNAARWINASTI